VEEPTVDTGHMVELRVKISRETMDTLLRYCSARGEKKPAVVRRAIERELRTGWPAPKLDGPL